MFPECFSKKLSLSPLARFSEPCIERFSNQIQEWTPRLVRLNLIWMECRRDSVNYLAIAVCLFRKFSKGHLLITLNYSLALLVLSGFQKQRACCHGKLHLSRCLCCALLASLL